MSWDFLCFKNLSLAPVLCCGVCTASAGGQKGLVTSWGGDGGASFTIVESVCVCKPLH